MDDKLYDVLGFLLASRTHFDRTDYRGKEKMKISNKKKNHVSFAIIFVIGFFALIILALVISSKSALPSFKEFYEKSGSSTDAIDNDFSNIEMNKVAIIAPNGSIAAEIADTPILRERGLGGRELLPEGKGMLFRFDQPGIFGFWMKDMKFPIDIVWIDDSHRVVSIDALIATSTYPDTFLSPTDTFFVLELPAGSAERFGIVAGTELKFVL